MNIIEKLTNKVTKRSPRVLSVKSAVQLTPNMRRVTFGGDGLIDFPADSVGAYVKLVFQQKHSNKTVRRTYTISQQRSSMHEIDIDFMLHRNDFGETNGVAAQWSVEAKPGDQISLLGPGPATSLNLDAERFLLAADMTALPALTANLTLLEDDAQGNVFIEVLSELDRQEVECPENVKIQWVVNDQPGSDLSPLYQAVANLDWPTDSVSAWVACEFKTMRKIRNYLRQDRGIETKFAYISSYWKKGDTEEQHKLAKQSDSADYLR